MGIDGQQNDVPLACAYVCIALAAAVAASDAAVPGFKMRHSV